MKNPADSVLVFVDPQPQASGQPETAGYSFWSGLRPERARRMPHDDEITFKDCRQPSWRRPALPDEHHDAGRAIGLALGHTDDAGQGEQFRRVMRDDLIQRIQWISPRRYSR